MPGQTCFTGKYQPIGSYVFHTVSTSATARLHSFTQGYPQACRGAFARWGRWGLLLGNLSPAFERSQEHPCRSRTSVPRHRVNAKRTTGSALLRTICSRSSPRSEECSSRRMRSPTSSKAFAASTSTCRSTRSSSTPSTRSTRRASRPTSSRLPTTSRSRASSRAPAAPSTCTRSPESFRPQPTPVTTRRSSPSAPCSGASSRPGRASCRWATSRKVRSSTSSTRRRQRSMASRAPSRRKTT